MSTNKSLQDFVEVCVFFGSEFGSEDAAAPVDRCLDPFKSDRHGLICLLAAIS